MKRYQFEEIVFWLSIIAFLLAYQSGIVWLYRVLAVISVTNFIAAIVCAWKHVKGEKEEQR